MNSAALQKLTNVGTERLHEEYLAGPPGLPGDVATSCLMHRRGVQLKEWHGLMGWRMMNVYKARRALQQRPMTFHYMTPESMRWVHANLHGGTASEIEHLEEKAFSNGCCCWYNEKTHEECLADVASSNSGSLTDVSDVDLIEQLRDMWAMRLIPTPD